MAEETMQNTASQQDVSEQHRIRLEKLTAMQEAGHDPFQLTKYEVTHHSTAVKENFDALEGQTVSVAGRMMSKRVMGKASFCNVQDLKGNIQSYVARDSLGEEEYKAFKKLDIGDIIGIKGEVFKTKTGEIIKIGIIIIKNAIIIIEIIMEAMETEMVETLIVKEDH